MSYIRVLPRDLFNEANLLKCYGRLWILLDESRGHVARFDQEDVDRFEIDQSGADGSIYVANITLSIRGVAYRLSRPLNSREAWPLYAECLSDPDADIVPVFDGNGNLSGEMRELIAE